MNITFSQREQISVIILLALSALCVILVISPINTADVMPFIISFPFLQIGQGMRTLSLAGGVGNVIAVILYIFFCSTPIVMVLLIRNKNFEDVLLPVLSIVLFVVMYYMINPGILPIATNAIHIGRALLGGIAYSLIMAYCVLRILRVFYKASAKDLARYIGIALQLFNILFVVYIFGFIFGRMLRAFDVLRIGNIGHEHLLGTTYVFIFLRHAVIALPYFLNIWIVFTALRLLDAININLYSDETISAAKYVSKACGCALKIMVLSSAGLNVLQLMLLSSLHDINSSIDIPVVSITFVLGALLLTRYMVENKALKDENNQFI